MSQDLPGQRATVVSVETTERIAVAVGFPVVGALAAWGLKLIAGWVAGLAWAPLRGPFKLVASIDEPWATVGALAAGIVAGVVLVLIAVHERLAVTVTDAALTLTRDARTVQAAHSDVDGVFMDGKDLVVLGRTGLELARERTDLRPERLAAAVRAHGHRWYADGDPHRDQFRLWVPDMPGLPRAANALLTARARAKEKKAEDDLAEMRGELMRLGVIVRDEKARQYFRVAEPPAVAGPGA